LRDRFVYWMFRLTILLMRPLPLRAAYRIAGAVAVACYIAVFRRQRRALNENLARVLRTSDPGVLDRMARRSFRQFGKFVIDFIHYPVMTQEEVRRRLRFEQFDELAAVAHAPGGALIVTLHYGTWDLGAAALAALGYRINAIADTFRYPPMDRLIRSSRERLGMRVIGRERAAPGALRALRRGEMLAMLIDIADEARDGIRVEFFGAPALVSSAPARIALRAGAWVVPAVVARGTRDDLEIRPVLDLSLRDFAASGDDARDVRELTSRIMRSLQGLVEEQPDQWFIFQRLWGAPPAGAHAALSPERPA
jgi:KDO2-lipid IV(A) lauroyltransferase